MRLIKHIFWFLVVIGIYYLAVWFSVLESNPLLWDGGLRVFTALILIACIIFFSVIFHQEDKELTISEAENVVRKHYMRSRQESLEIKFLRDLRDALEDYVDERDNPDDDSPSMM